MTDTMERREAIARVIDPASWEYHDWIIAHDRGEPYRARTDVSLEKADAILALSIPAREVSEERARDAAQAIMEQSAYPIWPADAKANIAAGLIRFATEVNADPRIEGMEAATETEAELIERVKQMCRKAGTVTRWATEHGLCDEQVSAFLRGRRPAEPKLLAALGLERVVTYRATLNRLSEKG